MQKQDKIAIDLDHLSEHPVWVITARMQAGTLRLLGLIELKGRTLHVRDVHVEGLTPGALGRAGLNALGYALMEVADVDELIVQGAVRTTGARPGRRPAPFRLSGSRHPEAGCRAGPSGEHSGDAT
ncbi:MAG: hypothetical protein JHC88_18915 [Niveispirillum sp.]|nr:hypothetical protein [Niveispirillum sp.]